MGDMITFVCGEDKFKRVVKKAKVFKTISAMLKIDKVKDIMPKLKSAKELTRVYYSYPSYRSKIKKFGLIALEFR